MKANAEAEALTEEQQAFLRGFEKKANDKLRTDGTLSQADVQRMWADYVNSKEDKHEN